MLPTGNEKPESDEKLVDVKMKKSALVKLEALASKSSGVNRWNDKKFVAKYEHLMNNFHCETVAEVVKRLEGGQIWGFSDEENPGTKYFSGDDEDGHHFTVVDNRYIVDPWMLEMEGRSVFDLDSSKDKTIIKKLYGQRSKWTRIDTQRNYSFTKDKDFT